MNKKNVFLNLKQKIQKRWTSLECMRNHTGPKINKSSQIHTNTRLLKDSQTKHRGSLVANRSVVLCVCVCWGVCARVWETEWACMCSFKMVPVTETRAKLFILCRTHAHTLPCTNIYTGHLVYLYTMLLHSKSITVSVFHANRLRSRWTKKRNNLKFRSPEGGV